MPCLVWRKGSSPLLDTRTAPSGVALRRSIDLSFLTFHDESSALEIDYLYEVQTSFLVTGNGARGWTAYLLRDSYLDRDPNSTSMMTLDR